LKVNIKVVLKQGILDPQGKAVLHAIRDLGYNNFANVRIGKFIEIELAANNSKKMKQEVEEICKKLLANPVMENYEIEYQE
jgi:phosphoribosylformylglycinamidine synthase PurS subunit